MDIKVNQESGHTSLEYNVIGGIFDFYFLAGSCTTSLFRALTAYEPSPLGPSPTEVAQQYSQIVGGPAEVPFWTLGFHQCRYGYTDYLNVADVVQNYSRAGIPLEVRLRLLQLSVNDERTLIIAAPLPQTMWTDIDLYFQRWTFTNDPQYFPLNEMQLLVR